MRDIIDAYTLLRKTCPTKDAADAAIIALTDAVSCYEEAAQPRLFLQYAAGYVHWLTAGLPSLTGEAMRQIGNGAPDIVHAFQLTIDGTLSPPLQLRSTMAKRLLN